jgi:hypothetical protein
MEQDSCKEGTFQKDKDSATPNLYDGNIKEEHISKQR